MSTVITAMVASPEGCRSTLISDAHRFLSTVRSPEIFPEATCEKHMTPVAAGAPANVTYEDDDESRRSASGTNGRTNNGSE